MAAHMQHPPDFYDTVHKSCLTPLGMSGHPRPASKTCARQNPLLFKSISYVSVQYTGVLFRVYTTYDNNDKCPT